MAESNSVFPFEWKEVNKSDDVGRCGMVLR